jgi:hypothetical protein
MFRRVHQSLAERTGNPETSARRCLPFAVNAYCQRVSSSLGSPRILPAIDSFANLSATKPLQRSRLNCHDWRMSTNGKMSCDHVSPEREVQNHMMAELDTRHDYVDPTRQVLD